MIHFHWDFAGFFFSSLTFVSARTTLSSQKCQPVENMSECGFRYLDVLYVLRSHQHEIMTNEVKYCQVVRFMIFFFFEAWKMWRMPTFFFCWPRRQTQTTSWLWQGTDLMSHSEHVGMLSKVENGRIDSKFGSSSIFCCILWNWMASCLQRSILSSECSASMLEEGHMRPRWGDWNPQQPEKRHVHQTRCGDTAKRSAACRCVPSWVSCPFAVMVG